jgi:hypothetical protein
MDIFEPIENMNDVGKKVIRYLKSKGFKVSDKNIIYFGGLNTDLLTANQNLINYWNDVRTVITSDGDVLTSASATIDAGWHYRNNPMNAAGCAQIAYGQYLKCWQLGKHFKQDALVQCGNINVYRDFNKDGSRIGDKLYSGDSFAINQHTTANFSNSDYIPSTIDKWSAGCCVGQYSTTHYNKFLPICRTFGVNKFDTTIVYGKDFLSFQ